MVRTERQKRPDTGTAQACSAVRTMTVITVKRKEKKGAQLQSCLASYGQIALGMLKHA